MMSLEGFSSLVTNFEKSGSENEKSNSSESNEEKTKAKPILICAPSRCNAKRKTDSTFYVGSPEGEIQQKQREKIEAKLLSYRLPKIPEVESKAKGPRK